MKMERVVCPECKQEYDTDIRLAGVNLPKQCAIVCMDCCSLLFNKNLDGCRSCGYMKDDE